MSCTATAAIVSLLGKHTDEIAPDVDVATAAAVFGTPLEGFAYRAAPALQGETLARETTRLLVDYLSDGGR